jgi:hypothetical protein
MASFSSFYQRQQVAATARVVDPCIVTTKVAGVTFDDRPKVVARLMVGEQLILRREPRNLYDKNAVAVLTMAGAPIGYIPRDVAARLAPVMDAEGGTLLASVAELTGDPAQGLNRGVVIRFTLSAPLPLADMDQYL